MSLVNSSKFNFASEISEMLNRYTYDCYDAMFDAMDEVSKEAVTKLKKESPKGRTKKYSKGWARKVEKGRLRFGTTIYGKTPATWATAHLLENGHVSRNGTHRDLGKVDAIVHIAPVEEWAMDEFIDRTVTKLADRTAIT